MLLEIRIECKNKSRLLSELKDIVTQIKLEIKEPICTGCKSCKDYKKGCVAGAELSDYKHHLESSWSLRRKYDEHKMICKSKQKK